MACGCNQRNADPRAAQAAAEARRAERKAAIEQTRRALRIQRTNETDQRNARLAQR